MAISRDYNRPLFDREEAETAKQAGIGLVESHNERWVDRARAEGLLICQGKNHTGPFRYWRGEVYGDQVRHRMEEELHWKPDHRNAYGSVPHNEGWIFTGRRHKSTVVKGHSNEQKIWRHVGGLTPEREDLLTDEEE